MANQIILVSAAYDDGFVSAGPGGCPPVADW